MNNTRMYTFKKNIRHFWKDINQIETYKINVCNEKLLCSYKISNELLYVEKLMLENIL